MKEEGYMKMQLEILLFIILEVLLCIPDELYSWDVFSKGTFIILLWEVKKG